MRQVPTACPWCNSTQRFSPKKKAEDDGTLTFYVKCGMCRREMTLYRSTVEVEEIRKRIRKMRHGRRRASLRFKAHSLLQAAGINLEEQPQL